MAASGCKLKDASLSGLLMIALPSCGLPEPPDIGRQMSSSVRRLGVVAFYPLRETPRIGQVYAIDLSAGEQEPAPPTYVPSSLLLSEALVGKFEDIRLARRAMRARYSQSSADLAAQLDPADGQRAFFRQIAPSDSQQAIPATQAIALGAIPGYTLAAVDQASAAAFVPQAVASFFAALGLSRTQSLRMEAAGIETAEIAIDEALGAIRTACADPSTSFGNPQAGRTLTNFAFGMLEAQWNQRQRLAGGQAIPPFRPHFYLLHRVYYLRGVRYVYNDSRVSSLVAQAALANQFPQGVVPPTIAGAASTAGSASGTASAQAPSPGAGTGNTTVTTTINNNPAPATAAPAAGQGGPGSGQNPVPAGRPAGGAGAAAALGGKGQPAAAGTAAPARTPENPSLEARLAAVRSELDAMRQALASGTNTRVGVSYGRATTRGIELVDLFDRPLAFGFEPIPIEFGYQGERRNTTGLVPLCFHAGGAPR